MDNEVIVAKKRTRNHLLLILTAVSLFGFSFGMGLRWLGMDSIVGRNAIVMVASYAFFFLAVGFWLRFAQRTNLISAAAKNSERVPPNMRNVSGTDIAVELGTAVDAGPELAYFVPVVAIVVIAIWLVAGGPAILIDAAFEVALSLGLIQFTGKIKPRHWIGTVLKKTVVPFLVLLCCSMAILFVADGKCPGKTRFSEIVSQCWIGDSAKSGGNR